MNTLERIEWARATDAERRMGRDPWVTASAEMSGWVGLSRM